MAVILSGNKDQLRKRALIERSQLKNEIIEELSKKISENLIRNFNLEKLNIHLFYPISDKKEVNTWHIHNKLSHSVKIFTSAYNNDSEAAAGGVVVGGLYRVGNAVQVRIA